MGVEFAPLSVRCRSLVVKSGDVRGCHRASTSSSSSSGSFERRCGRPMFGYSSDETEDAMPLQHSMATRLGKKLNDARKNGVQWWLRPDGQTEVTIEYLQRADPLFRLVAQSGHEARHQ